MFSNYATEDGYLPAVREACDVEGFALDAVGGGVGNVCTRPEELIGRYDLVFAKSRAALEALATGAAVILCDRSGAGPMVTAAELERLRPLNFGIRSLVNPITTAVLLREIRRYDPVDAAEVSRRIRATSGRDDAIDRIESLYDEVLDAHAAIPSADRWEEARAAASYLRRSPRSSSRSPRGRSVATGNDSAPECDRLQHALAEEAEARQEAIRQHDEIRAERDRADSRPPNSGASGMTSRSPCRTSIARPRCAFGRVSCVGPGCAAPDRLALGAHSEYDKA